MEFTGGLPMTGVLSGAGAAAGARAVCMGGLGMGGVTGLAEAAGGAPGALDAAADVFGARGVGGFAAGVGSGAAFSVPSGTRCEACVWAGTRSIGSVAGAGSLAATIVAGTGGGASSGSTLTSGAAAASFCGLCAVITPGKLAHADKATVTVSTDTNVLMSLCDRLFVSAHGSAKFNAPDGRRETRSLSG